MDMHENRRGSSTGSNVQHRNNQPAAEQSRTPTPSTVHLPSTAGLGGAVTDPFAGIPGVDRRLKNLPVVAVGVGAALSGGLLWSVGKVSTMLWGDAANVVSDTMYNTAVVAGGVLAWVAYKLVASRLKAQWIAETHKPGSV